MKTNHLVCFVNQINQLIQKNQFKRMICSLIGLIHVNSLTQLSVNNDLNFSLFPSQNDCRALEDLSFCAP